MMCNQEAAIESWTAQLHFVCMRDGGVDEQLGLKIPVRGRTAGGGGGLDYIHQIPYHLSKTASDRAAAAWSVPHRRC